MTDKDKSDLLTVLPKMSVNDSILLPIDKSATYAHYLDASNNIESLIEGLEGRMEYQMKAIAEGIRIWRIK